MKPATGAEPNASGLIARFGHFEILSRVGSGGMGEVFRARTEENASTITVALKLIRPENATNPEFREMFATEARITAYLEHENIVRVVDYGEIRGSLYLAMEFVDGVSLDRLLTKQPMPLPLAVHVVLQILAALDYMHGLTTDDGRPLALVHRDVSSTNVLVSRDGDLKLTDFGVARVNGLMATQSTGVKGKLSCMPPEQLRSGRAVDARADLFAVGVLLHQLALGRAPFSDVGEWVSAGAPLELSGVLADVIRRALECEPARRFASASEFSAAIRAVAQPDPEARAHLSAHVQQAARGELQLPELDRLVLEEFASMSTADGRPAAPHAKPSPRALPESMRALDGSIFALGSRARTKRNRRRAIFAGAVLAPLLGIAFFGGLHFAKTDRTALEEDLAPTAASHAPHDDEMIAHTPELSAPSTPPASKVESHAHSSTRHTAQKPVVAEATRVTTAAADPSILGYLTLQTKPWASVYLGTRRLGTTPFFHVPVPAGTQRLTADVEDKGRRVPLSVRIRAGTESRMDVRLP